MKVCPMETHVVDGEVLHYIIFGHESMLSGHECELTLDEHMRPLSGWEIAYGEWVVWQGQDEVEEWLGHKGTTLEELIDAATVHVGVR